MIRGNRPRMSRWPIGAVVAVFTPVFSAVLTTEDNSAGNFTICSLYSGPFSKNGSKVRLTLNAAGAAAANITDMWLGSQGVGNPYNFDGTQVQVTAAGATSFTVPAAGTLVTDAISYNFNASKNFIVAFFSTTGSGFKALNSLAGVTRYGLSGTDTVPVTNKAAGYFTDSIVDLVSQIEVFG